MLKYSVLTLIVLVGLGLCGCPKTDTPQQQLQQKVTASRMNGTVAEFAFFESANDLPLQGYGVVAGLGNNGSREVPANVKPYMIEYLGKLGFGSAAKGLMHMTPSMVLDSMDTGVVLVGGALPYGAPPGTRFDISVQVMPNTQTRSLSGGSLLQTELRFALMGQAMPGGPTQPLAMGGGDVFVNPFVDPNDERELTKWRSGRVLGGGRVDVATPVLLVLRDPDYARADRIRHRINEALGANRDPIAKATNRRLIELTVPRQWQDDYSHFLDLVLHIPLNADVNTEQRTRDLIREMEAPNAPCADIALILEATGRQVVPMLKGLYTNSNPAVAYYSARTAMRLKEESAGAVVTQFARTPSPLQMEAIEELGHHPEVIEGSIVLGELLDDDNMSTRIAAYEAIVKRHERSRVSRVSVDKLFTVDIVQTHKSPVIYATQTLEPRIVLFGKDMPVSRPLFFSTTDDLVTARCGEGEQKVTVFRKVIDRFSDSYEIDPTVLALVLKLGTRPTMEDDGSIRGLGLSYSQIVSVLYQMCEKGDIAAKFSLQQLAPTQTIYDANAPAGRLDAPPK